MTSASHGTVTVLFTDVVGSTALRQQLGDDEADEVRRAHFDLLRDTITGVGGREIKNLGDGLMVVFPSAVEALACAAAMQQAVQRRNETEQPAHRLGVRVGVHAGEPIEDEGDYFGTAVNIAKRLCDQAEGGQIVASALVRELVGSRGRLAFRDLGSLTLKGIDRPLPACEVVWEPGAAGQSATEPGAAQLPLPPLLAPSERTAFVGRERELQALERTWERARAGQRELALLTGEPGIGKTRLIAEFAAIAHADGANVLYGRSDEDTPVRCQPFVEALRHGPGSALASELTAASAEAADSERYALFEKVTAHLGELAEAAPLVLALDDLHWADRPTLLLLKQIVRSVQPGPGGLLILGAYRDTELAPAHPLSEALADLRRDRSFSRVLLHGLDADKVVALVDAWSGGALPADLARSIHQQTEGNPFFIEEVLRHLGETGATRELEGLLTADRTIAELGIPEGLKEVIGQRISRLSQACNNVLTIASVIGQQFGLDALERASDLPATQLLEPLEEAVAAHVVEEVPQLVGHYRFSHALIHETLYEQLTTTRRVRLHGQTLQYADSNGIKLAYEVLGASGPYLVAVGVSNCPAVRTRSLATTRHWDRMSRCCRVVLYDRRGVGFSAAPEHGYSLTASVEDLRAVLDAAGAERVVLWGAADGGPLAIAFAAQYRERVLGLLLLGTTPKYASAEDFPFGVSPDVLQSFLRLDAVDQGQAVSQMVRTRPSHAKAEAIGSVMGRVPRQAWSKLIGGVGAADARSRLDQVHVPTLIIHDPDNTYIPVDAAYYMHERIPGSELLITEEYGSGVFGEGVYHAIDRFIEEVGALGAR